MPWMSLLISLLLFVSLFLAFVRCFAMAIDMLRLVVCWNHIDGVAVWWVSPYEESLDNSLHMALTPALCRRCCGEFVADMYVLKENPFVLDRLAGLFPRGLVGGNCVSDILRNSWVVYPSLAKWSIVIGMRL